MTDTKPFATPTEAVACLREYRSFVAHCDAHGGDVRKYDAALESLEAALSTERESNTANMAELHRADARIGEQAARIRALESELDEKTARVVGELPTRKALAERIHETFEEPGWSGSLSIAECVLDFMRERRAPVALDRGEAVAGSLLKYPEQGELWDAVNDYATACGGSPDKHVGSIVRMNAVAAVESVVRAMLRRVSLPSEPVKP